MKARQRRTQRRIVIPVHHGGTWEPYDLWTHGLGHSSLSTWLTCKEQFRLEHCEGWTQPDRVSDALEFGNVCHHVLEMAYGDKRKRITDGMVTTWVNQWEHDNADTVPVDVMQTVCGMAVAVMRHYFKQPHVAAMLSSEWFFTEKMFVHDYTYPDGRVVPLIGKVDGAYAAMLPRRKTPEIRITDHKTSGIITDDTGEEMGIDFQTHLYKLWFDASHDKRVNVVEKNYIRRPGLKMRKDDTVKSYIERIDDDVAKRPDHYFVKFQEGISVAEMDTWVRIQLNPIMADVRLWWEGPGDWYTPDAYPDAPRSPRYINASHVKTQMRKVDLYAALTRGDFTALIKQGEN